MPPFRIIREQEENERRVPISNPAICALQLYVEDPDLDSPSSSSRSANRRFILAQIELDTIGRPVSRELNAAPMSEETAMDMWAAVFKGRTGWEWRGSDAIKADGARRREESVTMTESAEETGKEEQRKGEGVAWRIGDWLISEGAGGLRA